MNKVLAERIKQRYLERRRGTFPSADIKSLCADSSTDQLDLHADLAYYLVGIAGYVSGADRLHLRSEADLLNAKGSLSKCFFERFGEHERYRARITPEATPQLYRTMADAELDRLELLTLIDSISATPNVERGCL